MPLEPDLAEVIDPERLAAARLARERREAAARALADEKEMEGVRGERAMRSMLSAGLERYRLAAARTRLSHCGGCTSAMVGRRNACPFLFEHDAELHQIDARPLCRWAPDKQAIEDRAMLRRHRLLTAGVLNQEMRAVMAYADTVEDALPSPERVTDLFALEAPREAARAAAQFLAEPQRRWLVLYGSVGTWKTWAAAWVVAHSDDAVWLSPAKVRPDAQGEWDRMFSRALRAPLAVVNDVGIEYAGQWHRDQIAQIIGERDDAALRTVVTSNLLLTKLEAGESNPCIESIFGLRVRDRLATRAGDSLVVRVTGPSLREHVRPA